MGVLLAIIVIDIYNYQCMIYKNKTIIYTLIAKYGTRKKTEGYSDQQNP